MYVIHYTSIKLKLILKKKVGMAVKKSYQTRVKVMEN